MSNSQGGVAKTVHISDGYAMSMGADEVGPYLEFGEYPNGVSKYRFVDEIYGDEHVIPTGKAVTSYIDKNAAYSDVYYDENVGEYKGLDVMFKSMRDGKSFGVDIFFDGGTSCVKTYDNAGIPNPVPSTLAEPGSDPYKNIPAFYHEDVCGYPDSNNYPHVTSINKDVMYTNDGSAGVVCSMAPTLWWNFNLVKNTENKPAKASLVFSNTPFKGLELQPDGNLPDGTTRPFMLYPKYALAMLDGYATSASGLQPLTRTVSHNTLITICNELNELKNTSWSGRSVGLDWYIKVMFLVKYATRNSQSVFSGCTSYDLKYTPVNATDNQPHIDVPKSHGLVAGSAVMVGSADEDRNVATAHDVVDYAVIDSIDDSADGYARLNLDRAVTVATTNYVKTAPWPTGACDGIVGDGSPYNNKSGKEPFVLQGIELGLGMYEVMGNVVLKNDGTSGWKVYVNPDCNNEATTVTDDYIDTGVVLPTDNADSWKYPTDMANAGGMLVGTNTGGSTSTGMCDGHYTNKMSTVGEREFHALGNLGVGGVAGLFCVYGGNRLGSAWWGIGSRLSGTGRTGGEFAQAKRGTPLLHSNASDAETEDVESEDAVA